MYNGSGDLGALTAKWSESVIAPNAGSCGTASSQPTVSVPVDATCIQAHGGETPWQVTIAYADAIGGGSHGPLTLTLANGPPNYVPPQCAPTLTAAWGNAQADGVIVSNTGKIDGCGATWTYSLLDSAGNTVCSDATASGAPPQTIHYTSCGTPPDRVVVRSRSPTRTPATRPVTKQVAISGNVPGS